MSTEKPEYKRPRKIRADDDVSDFTCGNSTLDNWFTKFALINQASGMSTVFVTEADGKIAGYYALATGGAEHSSAPPRVSKGTPRHPIPVIILTRLAVSKDHQHEGVGKGMLRDALLRVRRAADEIGVRALLVHAKDEQARNFYLSCAEFEPSPTDPLHLFLLLKDFDKSL